MVLVSALGLRRPSLGPPRDAGTQALLGLSPTLFLLVDSGQRVLYANPALRELLGRDPGVATGRSVLDLVHERSRGELSQILSTRPVPPGVRSLRMYAQDAGGEPVPVEARLTTVPGAPSGSWALSWRDLREREALVEALTQRAAELARSNRELEQFAFVASHDLQEPLRMVGSYTQLLSQRYRGKLDKDADEFLAFAQDGAQRMRQLIDDLLAFSRLGTRGKPMVRTSLDGVLAEATRNLAGALTNSKAQVSHGPLPEVEVDASQMTQVLQNLLGNAVKFHGPGAPHVRVEARRDGTEWVISVQDDGIGIPPQYHDRVFVIFQRLHTREEYPGSGIGLAICKKVVERHGGRIWVESEGVPGRGTTFLFTLPAERHRPVAPLEAAPTLTSSPWRAAAEVHAQDLIERRMQELV